MLHMEKKNDGAHLTVTLAGHLDAVSAPELETGLLASLDGVTELLIDLEKLEYISSAGLRVLLSAQKIMKRQGEMKVAHVNETVREIFDVTGFTDILSIE